MFLDICRGLKNFCEQRRNFHAVVAGRSCGIVSLWRYDGVREDERMRGREVNEVRNSTSLVEIEERLDEAHG